MNSDSDNDDLNEEITNKQLYVLVKKIFMHQCQLDQHVKKLEERIIKLEKNESN